MTSKLVFFKNVGSIPKINSCSDRNKSCKSLFYQTRKRVIITLYFDRLPCFLPKIPFYNFRILGTSKINISWNKNGSLKSSVLNFVDFAEKLVEPKSLKSCINCLWENKACQNLVQTVQVVTCQSYLFAWLLFDHSFSSCHFKTFF